MAESVGAQWFISLNGWVSKVFIAAKVGIKSIAQLFGHVKTFFSVHLS